jgi:hypothetical protein
VPTPKGTWDLDLVECNPAGKGLARIWHERGDGFRILRQYSLGEWLSFYLVLAVVMYLNFSSPREEAGLFYVSDWALSTPPYPGMEKDLTGHYSAFEVATVYGWPFPCLRVSNIRSVSVCDPGYFLANFSACLLVLYLVVNVVVGVVLGRSPCALADKAQRPAPNSPPPSPPPTPNSR